MTARLWAALAALAALSSSVAHGQHTAPSPARLAGVAREAPRWKKLTDQPPAVRDAMRAGDKAPSFQLADITGKKVDSQALVARGPLVVCFFRGHW